jgi:pilus assembly protein TadC
MGLSIYGFVLFVFYIETQGLKRVKQIRAAVLRVFELIAEPNEGISIEGV